MHLIVGLGNKGEKYKNTRHNIGNIFVNRLAEKNNTEFTLKPKEKSMLASVEILNNIFLLSKPDSFMNDSGFSVKKTLDFNNIPYSQLIVVHDDLDMQFGNFKLVKDSGSGGNHGIDSIVDHLGTKDFWRLKIGIANSTLDKARKAHSIEEKKIAVGNFVLSKFSIMERLKLNSVMDDAIEYLINNLGRILTH